MRDFTLQVIGDVVGTVLSIAIFVGSVMIADWVKDRRRRKRFDVTDFRRKD